MLKIIKSLSAILLLICFSGTAFSQTAGNKSLSFVSKEGRFTIDLPTSSVKQSSSDAGEGFSSVMTEFNWNIAEGYFVLGYADLNEELKNPKEFLKLVSRSLAGEMAADGGKLLSEKEIMLGDYHGREVVVQLKSDTIGIGRFYIVKNRVYNLFSGWKKGENGESQLKILDSFKLLKS